MINDPLLRQVALAIVVWMGAIAVTMLLSVSRAYQSRRPVVFQYPRREGIVALSLTLVLFLITAGVVIAVGGLLGALPATPAAAATVEPAEFEYGWQALANQVGLLFLMALPFLVALLVRRQPLLSAGLRRSDWKIGLQLGLALAVVVIVLTGKVSAILNGISASEARFLLAMLAVGFVEEFIFRGFIQMRLISWLGGQAGWILTSAIYALWHVPQMLVIEGLDPQSFFVSLALLFGQGLVMGWIMRKNGHIAAPALFHAAINWTNVL